MVRLISSFLIVIVVGLSISARSSADDGTEVVIVFNQKFEGSEIIASHYAKKRSVPSTNILGLDLPQKETISRKEYQKLIEEPVLRFLKKNRLMNLSAEPVVKANGLQTSELKIVGPSQIKYLLLCRGVPLRIMNDTSLFGTEKIENIQENMRKNEASVDSELAALPMRVITNLRSGIVVNPTFNSKNRNLHTPLNGVLMVARLDGPSHNTALKLVDKAIQAEKSGLWGRVYVDHRGLKKGNYMRGDIWMKSVMNTSQKSGLDVIVEPTSKLFPSGFPMDQVMFYCGWYSNSPSGAMLDGHVEFSVGAFGYHLHSFSGATLRSGKERWVGPLLELGATAVMGTVYEPYLEFTPNMSVFWEKILDGYNFAQAAYSSLNALSWQSTVVGDPLYRPFGLYLEERHAQNKENDSQNLGHSLLNMVRRDAFYAKADNIDLRKRLTSHSDFKDAEKVSPDVHEFLIKIIPSGLETETVLSHYRKALELTSSEAQRLRLALGFANLHRTFGDPKEALKVYQFILSKYKVLDNKNLILSHLNNLTRSYGSAQDKILLRKLTQNRR